MTDLHLTGAQIAAAAWRTFERWRHEHDPDGNLDTCEAAVAYAEWASKNSIKKYIDAAQPSRIHGECVDQEKTK